MITGFTTSSTVLPKPSPMLSCADSAHAELPASPPLNKNLLNYVVSGDGMMTLWGQSWSDQWQLSTTISATDFICLRKSRVLVEAHCQLLIRLLSAWTEVERTTPQRCTHLHCPQSLFISPIRYSDVIFLGLSLV